MSNSGFWAGSIPPWAVVIIGCLLALIGLAYRGGLLRGRDQGYGWAEADAAEEETGLLEERRAARWLEGVRETRGGTVMPPDRTELVRAPEVAHEPPMWEYRAQDRANAGQVIHMPVIDPPLPEQHSCCCHGGFSGEHDCCLHPATGWDAHMGQALALTETDDEFTARLGRWADDIIEAARTAPDPYWDGTL